MTRFAAPISEQIWGMKYQFKDNEGKPIDVTVEDSWRRIASALAQPEAEYVPKPKGGKIPGAQKRIAHYEDEFYSALEDFKYLPAGRITAGAGTGRMVTLFNCFVMGTIPDSMDGIFSMLREAALTMQQGGGIGYDFSPIRPKGSLVKKLGADASGPLTFMDCWDSMCRTVMSAGSRRGAMMATMCCDHPDIEDFITAKQDPGRLRMFNMSVLVTDAFMKAVRADGDWALVHKKAPQNPEIEVLGHLSLEPGRDFVSLREDGQFVHRIVKARDLWNTIMRSTYAQAEPGVIFIDRINEANNLRYVETISATNPCGEQPLPPYGACLLGSINLSRLISRPFEDNAGMDTQELRRLVHIAVRMMDNVVDTSNFPVPQQREEALNKRRIGLGVTGVADALVMVRLRYGTQAAADQLEKWMRLIDEEAYRASIELAKEKGPFPLFNADEFLSSGTHASGMPFDITDGIREHGIRNALLTSIAPTGTISLYAGNVSSGVEPIFAYAYTRKVLQKDGSRTEERVEDYAVAEYRKWWLSGVDQDEPEEWSTDLLPDYFVSAQELKPHEHVIMQAAAQRHVDSSISKTINCPEDISFEDFKAVYEQAFDSNCKGCTTYRPNEITGSVLSVDPKPEPIDRDAILDKLREFLKGPDRNDRMETVKQFLSTHKVDKAKDLTDAALTELLGLAEGNRIEDDPDSPENTPHFEFGEQVFTEELPPRPEALTGATYKIKVGDRKAVYLTVNDTVEPDGVKRPFEIFLRSSDPTNDEWMVALARMISAILRRPHSAAFVPGELRRIHSATTGGFWRGRGYQPSLVAAIGLKLKEHMDEGGPATAVKAPVAELVETVAAFDPDAPCCQTCFSYNLKMESGCLTCLECGNSKCG